MMEMENIGEQLLDACLNDVDQAEWIISHHGDKQILNWQERKCRNSILHILVYQNLSISVELLLNSGADPNIVNKNGETPLHWAVRMNSFECARLLIHHSANVNKKDKSGSTPLHLCCAYGIPELIPLLLTSGSHLHVYDKEQKTPLDLAEDGGNSDAYVACAALLRRHIELFQSEDVSRFTTKPPASLTCDPIAPIENTTPETQASPPHSKQKTLPPFIAGSSMRVAQWEWKRALSEYTLTPHEPAKSSPLHTSSSPPRNSFPLVDERPKTNPIIETLSKLSDTKTSLTISPAVSTNKVPTLLPLTTGKQTLNSKQSAKIPLVLPFKPNSARVGDVFLSIEMCGDCHLHNWSLWHNEDRYNGAANECLRVIIQDLIRNSPKIRLFAYKSKVNTQKNRERIGALEVVVAVKSGSNSGSRGWLTHSIFSKLKSQSWPKISTFGNSASIFVNNTTGQVTSRNSSRKNLGSSDPDETQSRRKLELMFAQWHDRLYGNFRIDETDRTDGTSDQLNGSFYLPNIDGDPLEWEVLNMNHFLVYDGTDLK